MHTTIAQKPGLSSHSTSDLRDRFGIAHWTKRIESTLERLEREARRMLQLEEELSGFANHYYEAVGSAMERLVALEQKLDASYATEEAVLAMPAVIAQRDARAARRVELKARYRGLAKEIHPDRQMAMHGAGTQANHMHALNAAYQQGDLAALIRLEAETALNAIVTEEGYATGTLDAGLREVERAADTYATGYRIMLNAPINELMLRAMSARLAGWDWVDAVVRKIERSIEEKERAAAMRGIADIGAWREELAA